MSQDIVAENLAVVDAHFHSEASNEIERALDLYTDDRGSRQGGTPSRDLARCRLTCRRRRGAARAQLPRLLRCVGGPRYARATWDVYPNTPETGRLLDRAKPTYTGGILEMANARLYPYWGALTEALRTGRPQNEATRGESFFAVLQRSPTARRFLAGHDRAQHGRRNSHRSEVFLDRYRTFVDIGTAQGATPVQIALAHGHLTGGGYDLPVVAHLRALRALAKEEPREEPRRQSCSDHRSRLRKRTRYGRTLRGRRRRHRHRRRRS